MDEKGRPTSALFKQDNGVSVDRDGERNEDKVPLGQLKALILADSSDVVVYEREVNWI